MKKLLAECKNLNLNISFTSQRISDFSIEIYTGYKDTYKELFYTDGHIYYDDAIKEAKKWLKNYIKKHTI